jgi:hypothetical protein
VPQGAILVGGSIAQKPGAGGHAWVFLQYLLGFRRLGRRVLFVDRLEPEMDQRGVGWLTEVMTAAGLGDAYALLRTGEDEPLAGRSRRDVVEFARSAELFLNVMGFVEDEEILGASRRRVFLDIDPGFGQMWCALGLHDLFAGHDEFVTVGERVGSEQTGVPECGLDWIGTRPPVVFDLWPAQTGPGGAYTSVGAWRGPYAPIEYNGHSYGLRVHEFRRFAGLPRATGQPFEVALDIHPDETRDLELLAENGWTLVDPALVAGSLDDYRRYVQSSRGELMVAKGMYVDTQAGWFSDRSACYLASGRPVIAQDTGLDGLYPVGEGLLTFSTLDEAAAAVEEVERDYERHSLAARRVAEQELDSDVVLGRLLQRLGVG